MQRRPRSVACAPIGQIDEFDYQIIQSNDANDLSLSDVANAEGQYESGVESNPSLIWQKLERLNQSGVESRPQLLL